jgi:hypothetical protein
MTAQRHGRFRHYRCSRRMYRPGSRSVRYTRAEIAHADLEYLCRALVVTKGQTVWEVYLTLDDHSRAALIRSTFHKIVLSQRGIIDFELCDSTDIDQSPAA